MDMNWLKIRRTQLDLSQADVSRELQLEGYAVTPATISHWENERYKVPLDDRVARFALAKVLQLSVTELLSLAGYGMIEKTEHTEAGRRGAMIIDHLPPKAQEIAIEQLRVLDRAFNS